jgi:hypothetical protein
MAFSSTTRENNTINNVHVKLLLNKLFNYIGADFINIIHIIKNQV